MKARDGMKNKKETESGFRFMPVGMSIGISVGLALGAAVNNIPLYMCIGLCIGLGIGTMVDAKNAKDAEDPSQNPGEEPA